jgi:hypothetical protein
VKNLILLENLYLPDDLNAQIEEFLAGCYHERIDNLTPADIYLGHGQKINATPSHSAARNHALLRQTTANRLSARMDRPTACATVENAGTEA